MNRNIELTLATTLSILITFILFHFLNGKRATGSLFQHIVADNEHRDHLVWSCFINRRSMYLLEISVPIYYILFK
jgi:hypothetical protein